jgi:hypothetical protein
VVGDPAADDLQISGLTFTKAFTGTPLPGGTATLTFTITNEDPVNLVLDIAFTDDLDAVIPGLVATALPVDDLCNTGSLLSGTSVITYGRGELTPGQSCTFDVTVSVPCDAMPGTYTNVTSSLTALSNSTMLTINPAAADLTITGPVVSFAASTDLCINAGVQTDLGGGLPTGGTYSGPGVTDDTNGITYDFDPATAGVGTQTITYEFTNANSCSVSASDDVEVFALPVVTFTALTDLCVDAGVQAGLGGGSPTGGFYSGTGVTDDGNGMTYRFDPAAAGVGTHTITYDFTDANSCSASASDDVEIFALPTVTFTAPTPDICIEDAVQTGLGGGTPTGGVYSGIGVDDAANGMTFSFDPTASAPAGGNVSVTYTFVDANGCSVSASDDVFVNPICNQPPVAVCQPVIMDADANCEAVVAAEAFDGGSTDPDMDMLTFSVDPAGPYAIGTTAVTLTVSDGTETRECTTTVMVSDATDPTLTNCQPVSVNLDANGMATLTLADLTFTAADNCAVTDTTATPLTFDCDTPANQMITITVADAAGLTAECMVGVTVNDVTDPTLINCQPVSVNLDANGMATLTLADLTFMAADNCAVTDTTATPLTFDCATPANQMITVTVADAAGLTAECMIAVTVNDVTGPTLTNCQSVSVNLDANGLATLTLADLTFTAADNCAVTDTTATPLAFDCDTPANEMITVTVADASGGTASCMIAVTVVDDTPPTVIASNTTLYLDENGLAELSVEDFDFAISDNCDVSVTDIFRLEEDTSEGFWGAGAGAGNADGAKSLSQLLLFDCADLGNSNIRLEVIATDASGNEVRDSIFITVLDTVSPTAVCTDITVQLDAEGRAFIATDGTAASQIEGGSTDNCAGESLMFSESTIDFTCDDLGLNVVTLTVTDASGNAASCTASVLVEDNIAPVVTIIGETITLNDGNVNETLVPSDLVTATDNCDDAAITFDFDRALMFNRADIGTNTVTVTVTDANGQVTMVTVTIIVTFDQPNLACIGNLNLTLEDDCTGLLIPEMVLVGDVVLLDAFTFSITVMDSDTTNGAVVDGCGAFNYVIRSTGTGNIDLDFESCWGIVNAEDKTAPAVVTIPDDIDLLCVDLDDNNISTLANTVSHCYRVNAQTGATIPGTMAAALRARLLARTASPLVPVFTDGCSQELEICVSDAVVFGADLSCDDVVITRAFVASEVSTCVAAAGEGNPSVSASYTITFGSPTLDDLDEDSVDAVVEIESCGADASVRPAPSADDYPFLVVGNRTFNLQAGETVCNIGITYSDGPSIVTCPNTYKFVRTYTVIDWCAPGDIRIFTQVVKVGDTTAPAFTGPNVATDADGTLVYGTNAGNTCVAYIRLDDVSAVDNCPGAVSISAQIFPNGNLTGAPIGTFAVVPGGSPELSSAIPAGTHILRYTYSDVCGNTGTTDYDFRVEDQTPPVAICEDGLNLSIAGGSDNGFAVLTPANINNGSYDDCSGVTFAIARVNGDDAATGDYGPQITLTCADLGTVRVGLRVTDAVGNVNFCWLDVLLEDKLTPSCIAPANTTISCVDFNASLAADITESTDDELNALFGQAAGVDNCETTITQTVSGTINNCGVGRITRIFTSTDGVGFTNTNLCVQTILILGVHDYRITFPTDASGDCMEIPSYVGVSAEELGCDLITTTTDVDTLRTQLAGEECFKLRVTYDVVNWCEYNSLGAPYIVQRDAPGARDRTRNPRDIEADLLYVNVIPGTTTTTTDDDVAFYSLIDDRTFDPAPSPQRDQEYGGYAASDSRGFFRYTQFIKVYDELAPEIIFTPLAECFAGSGEGCRTTVTLEFSATDACSDALATIELDANFTGGFVADNPAALGVGVSLTNDGEGNHTVTATNVPVGAHAIRVRASDGCGNVDVQIIEFCVRADRTPTPICIQTLTVALMNDGNGGGVAAIWAADFIASPIEDCFGNEITKYSLYRSSEASVAGFTPAAGDIGIDDIDCDDFDNGTVSVRVYAFDDNGTAPDYCEVVVEVQDNTGYCGEVFSVILSGLIATQNDEVVEGVRVSLTSSAGMNEVAMSSINGTYSFTDLQLNADYTVQLVFNADFNAQNVRASDLVTGIGQILGTASFANAYQFVAADVNQDGSFDVFDILAGQRAILGLADGFAGGNWFMVEAGYEISMNNPYAVAFPEVFNANDLQGSITADFVAVEKMNLTGATGRVAQLLNVDDAQLESGQTRTILLDGTHLAGFQGTIELAAGLELITAELVGEGGLNLNRVGEGMIAVLVRGGGVVRLEVRATTSGLVSEFISLSDAVTVREGVALDGTGNALDLAFSADFASTAQNVLFQNMPNPVTGVTMIRFELAAAGTAILNVQDVTGRLVKTVEVDGVVGLNQVEVQNIGAAGVYAYTLTSGNFIATKQMVVVK